MSKDERIKKKVGSLLTKWHVSEEEKLAFLQDLEEEIAKPDEEEDLESVAEETTEVEEEPTEEVGAETISAEVSEDAEEPMETEPTEQVEEPLPEEPVAEEPGAESEIPSEPAAEPVEETPVDQPVEEQPQPQQPNEEVMKTIEGLISRIASLEDIVKKLGTPVQEEIGVEPQNPSGETYQESELDRYNRLRRGR